MREIGAFYGCVVAIAAEPKSVSERRLVGCFCSNVSVRTLLVERRWLRFWLALLVGAADQRPMVVVRWTDVFG